MINNPGSLDALEDHILFGRVAAEGNNAALRGKP